MKLKPGQYFIGLDFGADDVIGYVVVPIDSRGTLLWHRRSKATASEFQDFIMEVGERHRRAADDAEAKLRGHKP